jgi:DNA (cytosine-5)-methyltransferase 1
MERKIKITLDDSLMNRVQAYSKANGTNLGDTVLFSTLKAISDFNKTQPDNKEHSFTFIDLFAGIGGMRIGYENVGGKCVYSNEWNPKSQITYFANFGDLPEGDITKVDEKSIPDHDILVAGFPCQPFSIAGVSKKNSLGRATGFEDKTQGTLFFDVCRILKAKRPKAFMLENVKNLVSHDKGRTFKTIQESLDELDYQIFWQIIDGKAYVPQHRERIIIVGFDRKRYGKKIDFHFDLHPPVDPPILQPLLEKNVPSKYTLTPHLWDYLQKYVVVQREKGNGFGYGIASPTGQTRTLSARYYKDGAEILIEQKGKPPRRLTPRECAKLQGFPDSFAIPVSDCQAYHQFGNSVVVPMIQDIAGLVANKMKELDEIKGAKNGKHR